MLLFNLMNKMNCVTYNQLRHRARREASKMEGKQGMTWQSTVKLAEKDLFVGAGRTSIHR